ncbi:cGMP-specific 3',5'-cyclic phosphodiesterase-like [Pollicipes pollicipes]|uniref:cGMP-specific 3',5'-cyclic phosphodiesterase-like n=1 Tax=Pollicipes pollicipes TaxID=41117 RepID=UPI0018857358|nr:cGMP-specific 3',5'-cyclic phosphodiesterase-like [Pollicipes pollicipes]
MDGWCCSLVSAACRLLAFVLDSPRDRKRRRDAADPPQERPDPHRSPEVVIERKEDGVHISLAGMASSGSDTSSGAGSPPVSDGDRVLLSTLDTRRTRPLHTGRFLTLHKRRRKRLCTRQLTGDRALLDDVYHGPAQLVLERIERWNFNAFTLDTVTGGRSVPVLCVHLFKEFGLNSAFNLDVVKVWKCFSLIEEGYHNTNPYHNSIHAADVTQAMYCFLRERKVTEHLTPMERMAAVLGAVCHDLDHPGVNQPFLIATANHLATLYKNASVLENHHWRMAVGCVADSGMLSHLDPIIFSELMGQIRSLILATDIARQGEFIAQFQSYMTNSSLNMRWAAHRHFILQIALKCADISNPCRSWDISQKWSRKVCDEFYRQGDYERKLNLPITSLCDRTGSSVAKIQVGFFRHVVRPLFFEWHRWLTTPLSCEMMRNLDHNHACWERWLQQETEEETKTEMSDTDVVRLDDPTDDEVSESVSESELRELLTVPAHGSRRHSAPVNFPRPVARTIIRRESLPAQPPRRLRTETLLHLQRAGGPSLLSVCSLASLRVPEEAEGESDISAEYLLPDPSITSITAGGTATPLSNWTPTPNRDASSGSLASLSPPGSPPGSPPPPPALSAGEGRLARQRTFPLTQPGDASRVRYLSLPVSGPPTGCRAGNLGDTLRRRGSAPVKLGCAQEARTLARNSSFTEDLMGICSPSWAEPGGQRRRPRLLTSTVGEWHGSWDEGGDDAAPAGVMRAGH